MKIKIPLALIALSLVSCSPSDSSKPKQYGDSTETGRNIGISPSYWSKILAGKKKLPASLL